MENVEDKGNWLKVLIKELNMPSTAEFCRVAGLHRGLVDKLMAGAHSPRLETLEKIKRAFPQTNMNWLIGRENHVLQTVLDDEEVYLLNMYRKHIKGKEDVRLTMAFVSAVEWISQDHKEFEKLDINAKAVGLDNILHADLRSLLLLEQHQRRLISEVLRGTVEEPKGLLTLMTPKEKLQKEFELVNERIQKVINLVEDVG